LENQFLNDAVAIVLYNTVVKFLYTTFSAGNVFLAIGQFCLIFAGSTAVGVFVALLSALLFKYTELRKFQMLETCTLAVYAYCSYLLAEGLGLSGIVSILFCGITMAHYTYNNLSKESQELTVNVFQVFAMLTETLVFAYLGLSLFNFDNHFDAGFIIWGLLAILIARAAQVYPITWIVNCVRPPHRRLSPRYTFFIWFAGLRGAIAFALSLEVPTPNSKAIFTTTLMIILFTVIVEGGLTIPILEKLQIPMGDANKVDEEKSPDAPSKYVGWDRKYLKPIFTRAVYVPIIEQNNLEMTEVKITAKEPELDKDAVTHVVPLDD